MEMLYVWILIGVIFLAVSTLLLICICGCRKKVHRNEFMGIPGKVKITNDASAISSEDNFTYSDMNSTTNSVKKSTTAIMNGNYAAATSNGTCTGAANTRSLPELPVQLGKCVVNTLDNSSELYATLGENAAGEHPYAQLEDNQNRNEPGPSRSNNSDTMDGCGEIRASSAITGCVSASVELPYMTPPPMQQNQQHFSGDSQDSAKGYTSISVRVPIANIMPQQPASHYTVLSDDSDEMYAAITETYTSGSETYAQILPHQITQATHEATVHFVADGSFAASTLHSRQASSSSAASSPKDKRQANSPLPKPPSETISEMYAVVCKKGTPPSSSSPSSSSKATCAGGEKDDRKEMNANEDKGGEEQGPNYQTLSETYDEGRGGSGYESIRGGYETVPEAAERCFQSGSGYERIKEPGYEEISREEPNYEELMKPNDDELTFHCYATIDKKMEKEGEPEYASLKRRHEGNYETLIKKKGGGKEEMEEPPYAKISEEQDGNGDNNNKEEAMEESNGENGRNEKRGGINNNNNNKLLTEEEISALYSKVSKGNKSKR